MRDATEAEFPKCWESPSVFWVSFLIFVRLFFEQVAVEGLGFAAFFSWINCPRIASTSDWLSWSRRIGSRIYSLSLVKAPLSIGALIHSFCCSVTVIVPVVVLAVGLLRHGRRAVDRRRRAQPTRPEATASAAREGGRTTVQPGGAEALPGAVA